MCTRSFSLPEFVVEIQEVIKPVLNAYMKVSAVPLELALDFCQNHGSYRFIC